MEEVKQKSWFSKYWAWLLGGGCLIIVILIIAGIVGVFYKVSDSIKESEPYTYAFSKAIENKNVIAFLGEPIESNGIGSSKYNINNGVSTASLNIPIKGPKNEAEIIVEAEKTNNQWTYKTLYIQMDGISEVIYLEANIDEQPLDE